jgi:ADP-dependent NAD(P)H-hydrate dehydratase / NAD(P)H-hydrate epimerase
MELLSVNQMTEADRLAVVGGTESFSLMRHAGTAVAAAAEAMAPEGEIVVIAGRGNNGGDGFVAARHLHEHGKKVQVILLANPSDLHGDAAVVFGQLSSEPIAVQTSEELKSDRLQQVLAADLYLDAILGTGFKPPLSSLYAGAIALLNAVQSPVIAVDIPSGADANAMGPQSGMIARADAIITFTAARPAHVFSQLTTGSTYVAEIGSPAEAVVSSLQLNVITARDLAPLLKPRPSDSNKGLYGHALIVGGSLGKAGAAAMAGISALRSGAGLSTVATAKSTLSTVAGFHPELMTDPLPETETGSISDNALEQLKALAKGKTVVAIGPGISRDPQTSNLVRTFVTLHDGAMVVDADGLNAFEGCAEELKGKGRTLVITPHPGEMARLAGCTIAEVQKDRLGTARKFAREHELIVVLKGNRTLVVQPDGEAWVNTTGNPGMSTGGTGDILTGMVAGLLAQHPKDAFRAVLAAVHLHGLAGDVMVETMGEHSLIATDLLNGLPEAFWRTENTAKEKLVRWHG